MTPAKFIAILIFLGLAAWLVLYLVNKNTKTDISKNNNILFIGDSFTAGDQSYADQLKSDYPEINITKISKIGAKTDWMLQQAQNDISSRKYNLIFVLGGVNDIYALNDISTTKNNLRDIYNMARLSGAKVVGITIAPSDYYSAYDSNKGLLTDELNSWILNDANVNYKIDFNSLLKKNGVQDISLFVDDHLHANSIGHKLLAKKIEEKVFK